MATSSTPFHVGQEVALVDARTGEAIEIVRVKEIRDGEILITPYTTHFDLSGRGLPLEKGEYVGGGSVVDMTGRVLQGPSAPRWRAARVLPARHDIRPATDEDLQANSASAKSEALDSAIERRVQELACSGQGGFPLEMLRTIVRIAGNSDPVASS